MNTLVPEEEGKRLAREMKNKFSVLINQRELPAEDNVKEDDPGVEDPAKLERAIRNMITNLQQVDEDSSDVESDNEGSMCSSMSKKTNCSTLTLVAPKLDEIRAPCEKTFRFAKNITMKETSGGPSRPSVLQRHSSRAVRSSTPPSPGATSPPLAMVASNSRVAAGYLHQPSPSAASNASSYTSEPGYDSTYNIYEQSTSYYAPNERLNVQTFRVLKRPNNEISDDTDLPAKRAMLSQPVSSKLKPCIRRLANPSSSK